MDSLSLGKRFGWSLTLVVGLMAGLGLFATNEPEPRPVPVLQLLPVPQAEAETAAMQQALEEKAELEKDGKEAEAAIVQVLAGAELYLVLAQFDAWLHELETGALRLSARDIEADLKELVDSAREAGATDKDIDDRLEKLDVIRNASKA